MGVLTSFKKMLIAEIPKLTKFSLIYCNYDPAIKTNFVKARMFNLLGHVYQRFGFLSQRKIRVLFHFHAGLVNVHTLVGFRCRLPVFWADDWQTHLTLFVDVGMIYFGLE